MLLMTKAVFELYRNFDFRLAHPEKEWRVSGSWITAQTNMDMLLMPKAVPI